MPIDRLRRGVCVPTHHNLGSLSETVELKASNDALGATQDLLVTNELLFYSLQLGHDI